MIFRPALNAAMAHQQILHSATVAAHFLVNYYKNIHMAPDAAALDAPKKLTDLLATASQGAEVQYEDYEEPLTMICRLAMKSWNPEADTPVTKIAQALNQMDRQGWQIDNEAGAGRPSAQIPNIGERMGLAQKAMAKQQLDKLTPYDRLFHDASIRAIGAGVEAHTELLRFLQDSKPRQSSETLTKSLPKLNVEFVSEAALFAWSTVVANLSLYPKDKGAFDEALDAVEKTKSPTREIVETLASRWKDDMPWIPEDWIDMSAQSILGSAVSSKLETLALSSVDLVREIIDGAYKTQATKSEPQISADASQRTTLSQSLTELEETLTLISDKGGLDQSTDKQLATVTQKIKDMTSELNLSAEPPEEATDSPNP